MKKTSLKAFTLIEIMIVVVIIGILAVALFPKLLGAIGKTNDEARKSELKNMTTILLQYKNDNQGQYESFDGCLNPISTFGKKLIDGGYVSASKFPSDPQKNNDVSGSCAGYFYYKSVPVAAGETADTSYILSAKMESKTKGNAGAYSFSSRDDFEKRSVKTGQFYVETGL